LTLINTPSFRVPYSPGVTYLKNLDWSLPSTSSEQDLGLSLSQCSPKYNNSQFLIVYRIGFYLYSLVMLGVSTLKYERRRILTFFLYYWYWFDWILLSSSPITIWSKEIFMECWYDYHLKKYSPLKINGFFTSRSVV
jgi:hypothetical protein